MKCIWIVLCLVLLFAQDGLGILCYYCHQTSKECNNGVLDDIHRKNCSEDRCALMQYETPMPGRKVIATVRDCAVYTEHELLQWVSPDMKNPAKIILFKECDTRLCNFSIKQHLFGINVVVFVVLLLFML